MPSLSPESRKKILVLRREGLGAVKIRQRLEADDDVPDFPGTSEEGDRKRIERSDEYKGVNDLTGPWSLSNARDSGDAHHVLDVLAYITEKSEGRIAYLTNSEAEWVIRIRSARPQTPLEDVWELTRWYIVYTDRGRDTTYLDQLLSLQPWRSEEDEARTARFVEQWINRIRAGREWVPAHELIDIAPFVRRSWKPHNSRAFLMWATFTGRGRVRFGKGENNG